LEHTLISLTDTWVGPFSLIIFVIAYLFIFAEEYLKLRKSKPLMIAAGLIWIAIAVYYNAHGDTHRASEAAKHYLLEYTEIFLFLLAAMTYVNVLEERGVFHAIRAWLVSRGFSLRTIYWLTGIFTFLLSPIADNLTTALIMGSVVLSVGRDYKKAVTVGCINVVVAANAGGAFSPFGDVTTLMVWQKGLVHFSEFGRLLVPALVNWLIPAFIMSFAVPKIKLPPLSEHHKIKRGGWIAVGLLMFTIFGSVAIHSFLYLPSVFGMMTGLGILKLYGYWLKKSEVFQPIEEGAEDILLSDYKPPKGYDIFYFLSRAEWDTLMFFYGVVMCIGGLATIGYMEGIPRFLYQEHGATTANVIVGIVSALIDNVPVMLAVLTLKPDMPLNQWLLVTLTAGVGGSLLSIGSAAGVALMGLAKEHYTFFGHLKWTWAVAVGYVASVMVHILLS